MFSFLICNFYYLQDIYTFAYMYVYVANNCNMAMALRGLPDTYVCSYLCMTEDRGTQARGLWEHIK